MGRTSIPVDTDTRDRLDALNDVGSWNEFLNVMGDVYEARDADEPGDGDTNSNEFTDRLARLEARVDEAASNIPKATADEVEGRMRQ